MQNGFWDAEGLKGITTPVLFVAGSVDNVAEYDRGTKAIFQQAVNAYRYLLTYVNANHNAGAPIPAPAETYAYSETLKSYPFTHYADAVWDTVRSNNILQHFATAFLSMHLKGQREMQAYLDVVPRGSDGVYSIDTDGRPKPDHTYWKGFKPRTAVGLETVRGFHNPGTQGPFGAAAAVTILVLWTALASVFILSVSAFIWSFIRFISPFMASSAKTNDVAPTRQSAENKPTAILHIGHLLII